ncbi:hypothetical protein NMY22_g15841 [Coprinellus aureogranulatus]|nr:hypothetical protein NMY22_g15841 [Coprinellus aureogranulatus]
MNDTVTVTVEQQSTPLVKPLGKRPLGLEWRASYWFTTLVVGSSIAIDLMVYSIIIPVIPFQLEHLGYDGVSGLAGWLLFAYSGGLLLSTFPIAMLSERYSARRWPLIIGFIFLIASQIMFMEAPNYAVMCDCTPEQVVGQQLGFAMIGFSIGLVLGPPIGGALYERFGFRGPFIFGIIFSVVDLIGRLVIIERHQSIKWGYDPVAPSSQTPGGDPEKSPSGEATVTENPLTVDVSARGEEAQSPAKPLSFIAVLRRLVKSPRAMAAILISFLYGTFYSSQEPSIPVHLQAVWNQNSEKVGIIFIAAVVPTLFSGPLAGWLSDKWGTEWTTPLFLILAVPWLVVMSLESSLGLFIAAFGISSFFASGVIPPVTTELAAVSRGIEGVGYAHVYGAFNAAYGAGSTVGPVIGGQLYDHLKDGWQAIMYLAAGLAGLGTLIAVVATGDDPLLKSAWSRRPWKRSGAALNPALDDAT